MPNPTASVSLPSASSGDWIPAARRWRHPTP